MKRMIALAVLAVGLAVPVHAQTGRVAAGGGASSVSPSGGGGWGSGGFGGGSTASRPLNYPLTHFSVASVSGSQQEYVPSVFVSYDQAIATGQTVLDTPPMTVAEASRHLGDMRPEKAKVAFVQDDAGRVIIVPR
jgi:hypothetical protein